MKKQLIITPDSYHNIGGSNRLILSAADVLIQQTQEGWSIQAHTTEIDQIKQREEVLLTIITHEGKRWQGTMQDFAAIFSIAQNALKEVEQCNRFGEVDDLAIELKTLLSHVK